MNEQDERAWREMWAEYFDARAEKSVANARRLEPDRAAVKPWLDVAAGERACAIMLRSRKSLGELHAALDKVK